MAKFDSRLLNQSFINVYFCKKKKKKVTFYYYFFLFSKIIALLCNKTWWLIKLENFILKQLKLLPEVIKVIKRTLTRSHTRIYSFILTY